MVYTIGRQRGWLASNAVSTNSMHFKYVLDCLREILVIHVLFLHSSLQEFESLFLSATQNYIFKVMYLYSKVVPCTPLIHCMINYPTYAKYWLLRDLFRLWSKDYGEINLTLIWFLGERGHCVLSIYMCVQLKLTI